MFWSKSWVFFLNQRNQNQQVDRKEKIYKEGVDKSLVKVCWCLMCCFFKMKHKKQLWHSSFLPENFNKSDYIVVTISQTAPRLWRYITGSIYFFFSLPVNCSSSLLAFPHLFKKLKKTKNHVLCAYCILSGGLRLSSRVMFLLFLFTRAKALSLSVIISAVRLEKDLEKKKTTLFATSQFSYNPSARMRLAAWPKSAVVSANSCRWPLALDHAFAS